MWVWVVAVSVSLYDDGKILKGTGTRASKSRLATFDGAKRRLLFDLPNDERRTRRSLLLLSGKKSKERR
jgi:hypothetical protein